MKNVNNSVKKYDLQTTVTPWFIMSLNIICNFIYSHEPIKADNFVYERLYKLSSKVLVNL